MPPDFETDPAGDTSFPQRIHGKIFGSLPGGDYSCSGTVITSPLRNLVVTAGHCVFGQGTFADNWVFIPGYRNGNAPLEVWPANNLYAPNGWTQTESFTFDIGMATLDPVGGQNIETLLGSRGVAFNDAANQTWDMFGYPARPNPTDDGFGDYDSERLIVCDNATSQLIEDPGDGPSIGAALCFMQQGSSGGGWVTEGGNGPLESVVSHGYCQNDPGKNVFHPVNAPTALCGIFYGPYFGDAALNVYNAATEKPTPPAPPPPPPPPPIQTGPTIPTVPGRQGVSRRCRSARRSAKAAKKRYQKAKRAYKRRKTRANKRKLNRARKAYAKARRRANRIC